MIRLHPVSKCVENNCTKGSNGLDGAISQQSVGGNNEKAVLLGLESVCFKLTLTQYNQNLYQINFIEFTIALSHYALFCHFS